MQHTKTLLILVNLMLAAGLLFTADSYADEKPKYIGQESSSSFSSISKQEAAKLLKDKAARLEAYEEAVGLDDAENIEFFDIEESFREGLAVDLLVDDGPDDAAAAVPDGESQDPDDPVNPEDRDSDDVPGGGGIKITF